MEELLLTLDSSTPVGSIAVSRGEDLLGEVLLAPRRTHSEYLLGAAEGLLHQLDLDLGQVEAFAAVIGPGSFTGLRIGIGTIKGLALASGKPTLGVSSLQALAVQTPFAALPVCTLLDARKGEVYAGLYRCSRTEPVALLPEAVLAPEKLFSGLPEEVLFLGNGAQRYATLIVRHFGERAHFAPWPVQQVRASAAAQLALSAWRRGEAVAAGELLPRYIRLAEAEIAWSRGAEGGTIQG